ncbi:MAG: sugar-binding transcriptional regulator [Syntrophales bacterium]
MDPKNVLTLVEVAKMYYEQELTQADIAAALGVSRPLISNMLHRAKEIGIVNIEIRSPLQSDKELFSRLKKRYGLVDGLIIPANPHNLDFSLKNVLSQAALFVDKRLANSQKIGLGWGGTVAKLVSVLDVTQSKTGSQKVVCPLIGSMTSPASDWHPNELARRLTERIGGETVWLHAPAFPGTNENYKNFLATEEFQHIFKCWQKLDAAIVEIETYPSVPDQATAMRFGGALLEKQAVGGLLSYFYDISGNIIDGENDYVIRIPLEFLRKIKKIFLICSGNTKAQALLGALKMGLVTHLITDDIVASTILEVDI